MTSVYTFKIFGVGWRNWLKELYDTYNVVLYIKIETYALKMSKRTNVIPKNLIAHVHMKFVELEKVDDCN